MKFLICFIFLVPDSIITPSGPELDSIPSDFEVSSNCSHQNQFQEENDFLEEHEFQGENDFSSIVGRTIELMNEMKSAGIQLKKRTDFLKSQYLNLADEVLCWISKKFHLFQEFNQFVFNLIT